MPNQAKQRFLSLDVNEISVVDTPANEVEFLVMKRLEDGEMKQDTTTTEVTATKDAEVVSIESVNGDDSNVTKALEQVASMVENIAKAVGIAPKAPEAPPAPAPSATPTEVEAPVAKASDEEEDVEKGGGARGLFGKQLKAAGFKGEAMKKAMAEYDAAMSAQAKVAKADETPAAGDDEVEALKALDALESAIQKAKRFTPARESQLKSALEQLQKLFTDLQQVPAGGSPKTATPSGNSFGASNVVALTKAIESLTESVSKSLEQQQGLAVRLETIEKARTPSQSLEADGGTDSQIVNKSLWTGVL